MGGDPARARGRREVSGAALGAPAARARVRAARSRPLRRTEFAGCRPIAARARARALPHRSARVRPLPLHEVDQHARVARGGAARIKPPVIQMTRACRSRLRQVGLVEVWLEADLPNRPVFAPAWGALGRRARRWLDRRLFFPPGTARCCTREARSPGSPPSRLASAADACARSSRQRELPARPSSSAFLHELASDRCPPGSWTASRGSTAVSCRPSGPSSRPAVAASRRSRVLDSWSPRPRARRSRFACTSGPVAAAGGRVRAPARRGARIAALQHSPPLRRAAWARQRSRGRQSSCAGRVARDTQARAARVGGMWMVARSAEPGCDPERAACGADARRARAGSPCGLAAPVRR